jgi:hypothetical protein
MNRRLAFGVATLAFCGLAFAQGQKADRETVSAAVGGKKLSIDYGRPQLKGRALADLLKQLPADRIWRAGENQVTTFTAEGDVTIGGKKVPAGKYSLYVHAPDTGAWSLVLNSDPGIALGKIWAQAPAAQANEIWPRLDGYKNVADKEVLRAVMTKGAPAAAPVDLFTMKLTPAKDGASLSLAWGDQSWLLEILPAK